MCNLSTRTPVTYQPSLYRGEGWGEGILASVVPVPCKAFAQLLRTGDNGPGIRRFAFTPVSSTGHALTFFHHERGLYSLGETYAEDSLGGTVLRG